MRIESFNIDCSYPGLTLIFENPNLEFDYNTVNEEVNWKKITFETIYYCLINLLIDRIIEINYYEDRKSFLSGIYSYNTNNYTIKIDLKYLNTHTLKDDLSKEIVDSVLKVERKFGGKQNIKKVIKHLIRKYLEKENYHRYPEKKFLTRNINKYTGISGFKLIVNPRLFGLYSSYRVITENDFLIEFLEKHKKFKSDIKKSTEGDNDFEKFKNYLEFILERQFFISSLRGC